MTNKKVTSKQCKPSELKKIPLVFYSNKDDRGDLYYCTVYTNSKFGVMDVLVEGCYPDFRTAVELAEQEQRPFIICRYASLNFTDLGFLLLKAAEGNLKLHVAYGGCADDIEYREVIRKYHQSFETIKSIWNTEVL